MIFYLTKVQWAILFTWKKKFFSAVHCYIQNYSIYHLKSVHSYNFIRVHLCMCMYKSVNVFIDFYSSLNFNIYLFIFGKYIYLSCLLGWYLRFHCQCDNTQVSILCCFIIIIMILFFNIMSIILTLKSRRYR